MSDEEQYSAIGRLVMERVAAKRQIALLYSQLETFRGNLSAILDTAEERPVPGSSHARVFAGLGPSFEPKESVDDLLSLQERLAAITQTLKNIDPDL